MNGERHALKRAEISKMLSSIAGILLAGAFTFAFFAIEKSSPSWGFWIVLVGASASVVGSIIASGAAIDSDSNGTYVVQSLLLGLGFLGFAVLVPMSVPDKQEDPNRLIEALVTSLGDSQSRRISALEARLAAIEARLHAAEARAIDQCGKENSSGEKPRSSSLPKRRVCKSVQTDQTAGDGNSQM